MPDLFLHVQCHKCIEQFKICWSTWIELEGHITEKLKPLSPKSIYFLLDSMSTKMRQSCPILVIMRRFPMLQDTTGVLTIRLIGTLLSLHRLLTMHRTESLLLNPICREMSNGNYKTFLSTYNTYAVVAHRLCSALERSLNGSNNKAIVGYNCNVQIGS